MIGIACDHAGFEVKTILIEYLKELGKNVVDYGPAANTSVDYPIYAFKIGEAIKNKGINLGILICKTGIGMSIACNKIKGVRCAKVDNEEEAILTRSHNNSNVLAISALKDIEEIKRIIKAFVETEFSNEERHLKRVSLIQEYEDKNEY